MWNSAICGLTVLLLLGLITKIRGAEGATHCLRAPKSNNHAFVEQLIHKLGRQARNRAVHVQCSVKI